MEADQEIDLSVRPRGHMVSHSISGKTCYIIISVFHKAPWSQPYHVFPLSILFVSSSIFNCKDHPRFLMKSTGRDSDIPNSSLLVSAMQRLLS